MTPAAQTAEKIRVLYVVRTYPQLSQTYIRYEIEALEDQYEIEILCMAVPNLAYETSRPYTRVRNLWQVIEKIQTFRPHVIHTHWLHMIPVLQRIAKKTGIPYTVRAHSFDVLGKGDPKYLLRRFIKWMQGRPNFTGFGPEQVVSHVNSSYCLGVLSFPFSRPILEKIGMSGNKLIDCYPVISYDRFHDRGPNGNGVMNVGACIPKKQMTDFVDLGALVPERPFHLYPIGFLTNQIDEYNIKKGSPIEVAHVIQHDQMPSEYKKHQWLVYTASRKIGTVGWPLAIAEAQAAGVGACLANIRPDIKEYLGGAGFAYDSIAEVAEIIRKDVPEDVRERGFEQARKSDIQRHKHLLSALWDQAAGR
jgi:hypothetical protein